MKRQKYWNLAGFILGIAVIIVGICFIFTPAEHYSTTSVEDTSFGGDFYTYEYAATRAAARNAAITANNIRELSAKLALYNGTFLIALGVLMVLYYGKQYFCVASLPPVSCPSSSCNNSDLE